eukprot:TRINITY_DN2905_c1_g1::TRINITY_DN2905_c1_g1_i3::g.4226::m.4226 TRINITY_DN2905_c1_g1::TRINITY_DN2905_c1_g1_i3::g.4226  ORF type:complete len:114 (-),score=2.48 TRINITY_DN2905_c1_g1_i3:214-555(-)
MIHTLFPRHLWHGYGRAISPNPRWINWVLSPCIYFILALSWMLCALSFACNSNRSHINTSRAAGADGAFSLHHSIISCSAGADKSRNHQTCNPASIRLTDFCNIHSSLQRPLF